MDNHAILDRHIEFKKTSVHTVEKLKDIKRYLGKFIEFIGKTPLSKVQEKDVATFLNSLSKEFSIRTINDIKTYLKVFIRWHYSDYSSRFRNLNKLCKMQQPQRAYEPEQMISFKDIEKIVRGEKDLMYQVYWMVMFYGGFRPSEACRLKWNEIYFEPKGVIIKLHTKKTNKDFYKSLPGNVEKLLMQWKDSNPSEFVFPSPVTEGTIQPRSVCGRLKRLSKRVLGKGITPYVLRHSIATILYSDDNRKDDDTANQLGHSKSMKQVYMNLNGEELKAKARRIFASAKRLGGKEKSELGELNSTFMSLVNVFIKREKAKTPKEKAMVLQDMELIENKLQRIDKVIKNS